MLRRILLSLVLFMLLWVRTADAATRTWAGGTHNWSSTSAWVEGVVPTASDNVLVGTGTSGSTTGTLTIDGTSGSPSLCNAIDTTSFTGTISFGANAVLTCGSSAGGAIKFASGMTFAPSSSSTLNLVATNSGNNNFTSGGYAWGNVTFDGGTGTTYVSQDNFTSATQGIVTLTQGGLNINGETWIVAIFSSSNTNTRALTLGSGTLEPEGGYTSPPCFNVTTSTGMTMSAASGTINMNAGTINIFAGGGLTYGTVIFTSISGATGTIAAQNAAAQGITGANTFGTLTVTASSNGAALGIAANQTVTGTMTLTGNGNGSGRLFIYTMSPSTFYQSVGTSYTLTSATNAITYTDFEDITGAGAASWDLHAVTGLSGDAGGNSGMTLTTGINCYWVSGTGNWGTASKWQTTSGGSTQARIPLPQDSAIFDANSFTAGSQTVTLSSNSPRLAKSINFTGVTNSPTFAKSSNPFWVFGNYTMISSVTQSGSGAMTLGGRGSQTTTFSTTSFADKVIEDAGSGTYTQQDNITLGTNNFDISSGTWTQGAYSLSSNTIILYGGTMNAGALTQTVGLDILGGTLALTGSITDAVALELESGGTLALSTYTLSPSSGVIQQGTCTGTGTIAFSSGLTFNGSSVTYVGSTCLITDTTTSFNGAGSTYSVDTITGTGSITITAGTIDLYGTVSSTGSNISLVPKSGGSSGGGISYSRIFGGF